MAFPFTFAEGYKLIAATPQGAENDNGGITFRSISLRYAHKVWFVALFQQVVGHATVVQLDGGATVATATNAITFATRWWLNTNIATNDTLVEQTAATAQTLNAGATDQMLVVEIDPADLMTQNGTYDCLGGGIAATGQDNYVGAFWVVAPRYQQATPPSMVVD